MADQTEKITKAELLEQIHQERQKLEEALSRFTRLQLSVPGVEGDWNAKDVLAHIVAWEQRMIRWMSQALSGEIPLRPANWDEVHKLNEESYQEDKRLSLDQVLEDFERSYPQALAVAESTEEKDLLDPERFPWRNGSPLWVMVAANTCWHYREHRQALETWLEQVAAE